MSPIIFLMGPTASGKTDLAIALGEHLPVDIISVDSAMVYRGLDIGTAKPAPPELARVPHRLIDICDPARPYSAADFCRDARREIRAITGSGRIPLLVGGTMMYFRALLDGLANMPASDPQVREMIEEEARQKGWPALHSRLRAIDPEYACKLHPNHSQRICRALEVYRLSGRTMSDWRTDQDHGQSLASCHRLLQLGLFVGDRSSLHRRIEKRFLSMLQQGFIDEVWALRQRGDLHPDLPSMRAVGYRQVWRYLDLVESGEADVTINTDDSLYREMVTKGIAATRQLARRQLTWLRNWPGLQRICSTPENFGQNIEIILKLLDPKPI